MHTLAKKELIKKGLELADTVVTIFELDEKIDDFIGIPWQAKNTNIEVETLEEINEITKRYNLVNKGEAIYKETKRSERIEKEKEEMNSFYALIFCMALYSLIGFLFIKFLISI